MANSFIPPTKRALTPKPWHKNTAGDYRCAANRNKASCASLYQLVRQKMRLMPAGNYISEGNM